MKIETYSQYFPLSVPVGTRADVYLLSTLYCATLMTENTISDHQIAFIDGQKSYQLTSVESVADISHLLPMYEKQSDTGVATGNLSIRLRKQEKVQSIETELNTLGYQITSIPDYAPHSAWLAPSDGDIAGSLNGLAALQEKIKPVHIEAQLLRLRANRSLAPVPP